VATIIASIIAVKLCCVAILSVLFTDRRVSRRAKKGLE
jgi:hypothetical protein